MKTIALLAIYFFSLLCVFVTLDKVLAAELAQTLVIRPEKLPAVETADRPSLYRNPFQWPAGQLQKFKQAAAKEGPSPFADITLNAIIYSEDTPQAVINNVLVREGDTIRGARVTDIGRNSVTLNHRGRSKSFQFDQGFQLQTSGNQ